MGGPERPPKLIARLRLLLDELTNEQSRVTRSEPSSSPCPNFVLSCPPLGRQAPKFGWQSWRRGSGALSRGRSSMEIGLGRAGISRWVDERRLHRVYPGVFAVGHDCLAMEGVLAAALFYAGKGSALSHVTAGWWYGMLHSTANRACTSALPASGKSLRQRARPLPHEARNASGTSASPLPHPPRPCSTSRASCASWSCAGRWPRPSTDASTRWPRSRPCLAAGGPAALPCAWRSTATSPTWPAPEAGWRRCSCCAASATR